ncbi:MAG: phosphoribosylformylglycinamidine synthase subunit PurL [Alphaproteobacteria bacterium]|nr:phosphoribosylformylglycinamidine synthase subunit PurL [Alphaproteobacteria bacterium]
MTEITPAIVAEHGLSPDEYAKILQLLNRAPNLTELGIFSVMWSEHCSYKSTRVWLKTLPTTGPCVIHGPGENAGVIDIGDGDACIFKMESHNHPSFIEPYQGAATGVGGIMRDVFTMGARPVAMLNALRFGEPSHPKTRHLVSGVVAGIGGYGNCMGVPTVAGEVNFDPSYNGNILVNAMCVGLARQDKIFLSAASGIGNPVVYVGSKTGRDGIHGATMASAEFDDDSEEKRPTVQVGDPFVEKLLLEACLELMESDAIVAIQDMGAAGLTSSSAEMASKGDAGLDLDLDAVPQREEGMTAYEMLLSESQERMLMILKPGREAEAQKIFDKWGLDFAIIGRVTDTRRLVVRHKGKVEADLPVSALADEEAPRYTRPWVPTPKKPVLAPAACPAPADWNATLLAMVGSADLASRRWIWEQYDSTVMNDTAQGPGGDAAVVRVHGTQKALAVTADCTPRYCLADPVEGGKQAVAETWRNITAVGGTPLAFTDNMNFGNPQKPEIMGQFVGAVEGLREAGLALGYPVVSGNCSLYNETNGQGILPTPAIGGVGLLKDVTRRASIPLKRWGDQILLIGRTEGWLGASIYARDVHGLAGHAPPPVDLAAEKRNGDFVRGYIERGAVDTVHDLSDGGLIVALAEMIMAARIEDIGAQIDLPDGVEPHAFLFGEDQGRYLVAAPEDVAKAMLSEAQAAGVPAVRLGVAGGVHYRIGDLVWLDIAALRASHESFFPTLMAAPIN